MKLPKTSYNWAMKHLQAEGDTDLFPSLFEVEAMKKNWPQLLDKLAQLDVSSYTWQSGRSFVVPKDRYVFRRGTQLEPLDSLVLAAFIKSVGKKIEAARVPMSENRVFSYRFSPDNHGRFYSQTNGWYDFWKTSYKKALQRKDSWVAVADITDFYNQIYHHNLENQVEDVLGKAEKKIITKMLQSVSDKVSRGIPVGPHSVHILAELALNTIDGSLNSRGYDYCRYVDDIHVFCDSEKEAEIALYDLAEILDRQQKLTIQKQKTKVMNRQEFMELALAMSEDRPLNQEEKEVLEIIAKKTSSDPYRQVSLATLSADELSKFGEKELESLLKMYLSATPVDYARVGWFLRRLSQVGAPGALNFILDSLEEFLPVLGNVGRYVMAAAPNYDGDVTELGEKLLRALDDKLLQHSEYLQIILLHTFTNVPALDHVEKITARYYSAGSASVRREIVCAAISSSQGHWLRELKSDFANSAPWLRRAIVASAARFPGDEGKVWTRHVFAKLDTMERIVSRYVFKEKLKADDVKLN
ncbi:MAG: hypothetical protein IPM23_18360 [Candidatus Melainabacteria bacterium]|nr:hypothetical protein [Candidatus Melainabacteria bacterium]